MGGGETSCCHNDNDRSERNGDEFGRSKGGSDDADGGAAVVGKIRSQ